MLALAGVLTSLLIPTSIVASGATRTAAAIRVPTPHWNPCHRDFECARVWVPLDYSDPGGPNISIALIKLPAKNPARKIGSIFLNPGGPGGSGVDFVRFAGPELFSPRVRARFDLVGFDPRGILRSTPLRCFRNIEQAFRTFAPYAFPVTHPEEKVWVAADRKLADACAARGGPIMDHMTTSDVARDMDLLRQAVGDSQLTYYGVSYGTYLGEVYANLFPDNVRALVIDGVIDPIGWATGRDSRDRNLPFSTRIQSAQGAYDTLNQFFELCDRGGTRCAFSDGNPRLRFKRLAHRLRVNPLEFPDGGGGTYSFTYADLIAETLGAMYDSASWPYLAYDLQSLSTNVDPTATAAADRALRIRLAGPSRQDYPNYVEGFPGVACSDTENPPAVRSWRRAGEHADEAHPYFGRLWTWISSICQPWPAVPFGRYLGPFTHRTANPVLVIGNHFDPATRYQGAVIASRLLPDSRLLTLDGWGHTSLFESACIDTYLDRYLLTQALPDRGTVCQPDQVPFAPRSFTSASVGPSLRAIVIPPFIRRMIRR